MTMTPARFHPDNTIPKGDWIWVFGSNQKGQHGKGAAKVAHKSFGAVYGIGTGPTGRAYAIPTKSAPTMNPADVLALPVIEQHVKSFLQYARCNPKLQFFVTAVGTGLSGLKDEQVAPMFADAPVNCSLPEQWRTWVGRPEQVRQQQEVAA